MQERRRERKRGDRWDHEATLGAGAELVAEASLVAHLSRDTLDGGFDDGDGGRPGRTLRAAVNHLQHTLLTADPLSDVYGLALPTLMRAAAADRVCAYANTTGHDGRVAFALYAEAFVSPEFSLLRALEGEPEAYADFTPDLFDQLASGESFASRTEFLPNAAAARLRAQGAEAVLLLPLFVDGVFHGFLRLDRCDNATLWDEAETAVLVSAAGSISAAVERQQVVSQLVQRSHELAALLATSRSITSSIDYDVVLHEVACAAAEALGCPEAVMWEYVLEDGTAVCRLLYEHDPQPGLAESVVGSVHPIRDYPGGMDAVRAGVVVQQSLSGEDLSAEDRAEMQEWGEKTWLHIPLAYGEELLGMMVLIETERERRFGEEEVRMASLIGEQAAAALHNARLHRREEDQHRWLAALAEATRVISSRLDPVALLQDVARLATQALLVDGVLVYEKGEDDDVFIPRASAGDGATGGAAVVDRVLDAALRRGELVLQSRDDDALAPEVAAFMEAAGERTAAWVPFTINDETVGAMRLVARSGPRRFAEEELSFARALAEHAAIALNNARLYAQIEDQATRDGLTGLANHRHFYDRLAEEVERARRSGSALALLMFDIDDFKRLNDTYGHPAGDTVLRMIGSLMREELRRGGDLAARYGGEEFCVILPGSGNSGPAGSEPEAKCMHDSPADSPGSVLEGATALAERLRGQVAACHFPIGPDDASVLVSISVGVASWRGAGDGLDELVARADAALYAAKRAGKDRVEVY